MTLAASTQGAVQAWSGFLIEWVDVTAPTTGSRCAMLARRRSSPRRRRARSPLTEVSGTGRGLWWSATMSAHIGYESWLERDQALLLDFDCEVVSFAAQPFWLMFTGERGPRSHAPDFVALGSDGSGVVIDGRPDDRIRPRDAKSFAATARACALVGWEYERNGAADAGHRTAPGPRHRTERLAGPGLITDML